MKKIVLLLTIALFAISGFAQQRQRATPEDRAKKQTEAITKELNLSDSQKEKVYEINLKYINSTQNRLSKDSDRQKMREEFEKQQKSKDAEIKALLNEDQQKKYDKWQKEDKGKTREGGRRGARR